MPLTKKDLSQVKGLVHNEVENLARVVAKGFEQVNKQFEQVNTQFEIVSKRLERLETEATHTNARLALIEHDISEIRQHFAR